MSTNTHRSVHSVLSRIGVSTSYSSNLAGLRKLGLSAAEVLQGIGKEVVAGVKHIVFIFDNLNQQQKIWRPSLGKRSNLESGTAATLLVQEGVTTGAFDGASFYREPTVSIKEDMTFSKLMNDINPDYYQRMGAVVILRVLIDAVPALKSKHLPFVKTLLSTPFEKGGLQMHQLKERKDGGKTEFYPMEISGYDEATTAGCKSVAEDLIRQVGITEGAINRIKLIFGFAGDQLTIARLRSAKHYTKKGRTWFDSLRYMFPFLELWHTKFNFLGAIIRSHWAPDVARGDFGLRSDAAKLGRDINVNKIDFYPTDRLADTVLTARTLNYVR